MVWGRIPTDWTLFVMQDYHSTNQPEDQKNQPVQELVQVSSVVIVPSWLLSVQCRVTPYKVGQKVKMLLEF